MIEGKNKNSIPPIKENVLENSIDYKTEYEKLLTKIQKLEEDKEEDDTQTYSTIHDIKNKYNAIFGFLGILEDNENNLTEKEKNDYLKIIKNSSKEVYDLSEEFLTWKKAGSSKIEANISKIEMLSFVESFIDPLIKKANEKKIIFNNKIDENISVVADYNMLKSVLENLILNAVKFTEAGGSVVISNEQIGSLVKIYVKDSGKGIPKEEIDNLFKLGHTTPGTNGEKGNGVGLYTCKKLVEKMNGTISVDVKEGEGTTFIVTLPEAEKE